jgi:glycosyltransferase involved in cell wall biosynthesis
MVEALSAHFDFYIVTLNRDSGSAEPYTTVQTGSWNAVGMAQVFYTPRFTMSEMNRIANELRPDVIYFNGFFSTSTVLGMLKRKFGGFRHVPAILATRGDLAGGALGLKAAKKRLYIRLSKTLGLYRNLLWQASSEREKAEMLRELEAFGVSEDAIHVAPDLAFGYEQSLTANRPKKIPGEAAFVTVGRITRMKNLSFTIDRLRELKGKVSLDIFGPLEDPELWAECNAKIRMLPERVTVRYHGAVDPAGVISELATRHFFILPTLGENYGHVIIEGAAAGCPVVISNRTQWLGLAEKQVGWALPLEAIESWRAVLQGCVDMDEDQFRSMSNRATEFGKSVMNSVANLNANIELFGRAIATRQNLEPIATGTTQ